MNDQTVTHPLEGDEEVPSLYVWEVQEADGRWGTITAAVPDAGGGGMVPILPLVHHERAMADHMGGIAVEHHTRSGRPVRLVCYEDPTVVELWP